MPTTAAPRTAHEITSSDQFNLLEMPWRTWGDPASLGTFYQLGYDAWRNWAEMQLSLLDACWKMGSLTLDVPNSEGAAEDDSKSADSKTEIKLKKISNG